MKELSVAQAAYIAGMVDGEGNVGLSRSLSRSQRAFEYSPCVGVTNTHLATLTWLKQATCIGHITPKKPDKPNWKISHEWSVRSFEQKELLTSIRPYLVTKALQADLMLEFHDRCIWAVGKSSPPQEVIILRQLIFEELAELNRRGN